MKFLRLAYENPKTFDELSPADWQALRTEVLDYVAGLRASGRLIDARPLQRAENARKPVGTGSNLGQGRGVVDCNVCSTPQMK